MRKSFQATSAMAEGRLMRPGEKKTGKRFVRSVTAGWKNATNCSASRGESESMVPKKTNIPTRGGGNLAIFKTFCINILFAQLNASKAARPGTAARK